MDVSYYETSDKRGFDFLNCVFPYFSKLKLTWPRLLKVVDRSGFDQFQPIGRRFWRGLSCHAQIGQPFQIPTPPFELQFQPVMCLPHMPHPPAVCAPPPPPKHFSILHRIEQNSRLGCIVSGRNFCPRLDDLHGGNSSRIAAKFLEFQKGRSPK
jgi:hypothetical protein